MSEPAAIGDLVDCRARPTVVRLGSSSGPPPDWIVEAFWPTSEVRAHLEALTYALGRPHGVGAFLVGQYGSGKSHFLAYLAERARAGTLADAPPHVVAISLVEHRATARLEDVVLDALGIDRGADDRRVVWTEIAERHPRGVLLLLDELSEFLRSKEHAAAFHEDVRFLQFLGEWAGSHRVFIVAAMQEEIEHTGKLEYGAFRKIKDRYPLRLLLTGAHVRDLVRSSILVKKPGYEEAVAALVAKLTAAMPRGSVDAGLFASLYPVHPMTLELLDEVRDRFSNARGVVDFLVTRLRGDPARRVEPFLARPWGTLLTPDAVIAHFEDVLELQPEFQSIAQHVLPYYRAELPRLFDNDARRALAERVLRLLVLVHLSPRRERLTAKEAASWLVPALSRVDPSKNETILRAILDELATNGRYVEASDGAYALDLHDDSAAELERLLTREKAELSAAGDALFGTIAPLLAKSRIEPLASFNPLSLVTGRWQSRKIRWHFHERSFAVFAGDEAPPRADGLRLVIRLPWGDREPLAGAFTIVPAPIEAGARLVELCALARLLERPLDERVATRVRARFSDGSAHLAAELRGAYAEAALVGPSGSRERLAILESATTLDAWLERHALIMLEHVYPRFETYAPSHGPLPRETYRAFMRAAVERDICAYDLDDQTKLLREAYLVPMGLLEHKGRDYAVPKRLETHELVRSVLRLAAHQSDPKVIYEHLSEPVLGLVPDQIHVLLLFLLVHGEIDLQKEGRSLRSIFETLPLPRDYDRVLVAHALSTEEAHALEILCEALEVARPKQWTALAERAVATKLAEAAKVRAARLRELDRPLSPVDGAEAVRAEVAELALRLGAVSSGVDPVLALRDLARLEDARSLRARLAAVEALPARVDRIAAELKRVRHLFAHPALPHEVQRRAAELGDPPGLDRADSLDMWLGAAARLYREHERAYRARHDAYWDGVSAHPIFTWRPPPVAASRHIGLEVELERIERTAERARAVRCRGISGIDYQPQCLCGFDGSSSPIAAELAEFDALSARVEADLAAFFTQPRVRAKVEEWSRTRRDSGAAAYLAGGASAPEISDVALFDRHLAGLELVKTLSVDDVVETLRGRSWDRSELARATAALFDGTAEGTRLRFESAPSGAEESLLAWCLEQCLRFGVELPSSLTASDRSRMVELTRAEWTGEEALARLEDLNLGEPVLTRVIGWVVEGRVRASAERASPLVRAALEVRAPTTAAGPRELGTLAAGLYASHEILARAAEGPWLERLDRVARSDAGAVPALTDLLAGAAEDHWCCVDALGVVMLEAFERALPALLPGHTLERVAFATVSPVSTTGACYADLARSGIQHAFEKVDAIDRLIHERFVPFRDLERLAAAELELAFRSLRRRLGGSSHVLLFGDHGFRLASDGRSYVHGGTSTLERVVPVLRLRAPR